MGRDDSLLKSLAEMAAQLSCQIDSHSHFLFQISTNNWAFIREANDSKCESNDQVFSLTVEPSEALPRESWVGKRTYLVMLCVIIKLVG